VALAFSCVLCPSFARGTTAPLKVTTSSLPAAYVDAAYSTELSASGGSGKGYTWSIESGEVSFAFYHFSLSRSGEISGTPPATGAAVFTVRVKDSNGDSATASYHLPVGYPTPTGPLSRVRSFEYVIAETTGNPSIDSEIANSRADLVILGACLNEPALNRSAAGPSGAKLIFSYLETTAASSCLEPSLFDGARFPSWFGKPNPQFPGLYSVQFWNPAWEPYVFAVIDQAIADGFDGIFLDSLGTGDWSAGNIYGDPIYPDALQGLEKLFSDIMAHIREKRAGKRFFVMANDPQDIALANLPLLKQLDVVFIEVAYYGQSPTNGTVSSYLGDGTANWISTTLYPLYESLGVPILGNDYPHPLSDASADMLSFDLYSSLGWVPSVTTPLQTDLIFSTGPFMFMAQADNPRVTGYPDFVNFLSGAGSTNATLIGGNMGDFFLGGPGRNTIQGGAGDDMIYAHPANAGDKGKLIVDLSSSIVGHATTPVASIELNEKEIVAPTPITAATGSTTQRFAVELSSIPSTSSLVVTVTNTSYSGQKDYSNVEIDSISYNGVSINLGTGQYPDGGGPPWPYTNNGTVTFPGWAFAAPAPFQTNTSDVIDGGGGVNTVVYRAPYSNYTVTQQADGTWLVTSKSTAEGPDTLSNVTVLQFSDRKITLP
jgi:hypothetical protein